MKMAAENILPENSYVLKSYFMKTCNSTFASLFFLSAILFSCSKENASLKNKATANTQLVQRLNLLSTCDQFAYPDTIFYPQELPNDYTISPVNALAGTYGAYPDGLKINNTTGKIDVTESETGLKYIVWFIASGSTDTCKKFITLSGVNFTDSIYVLNNKPGIAAPVYNATPNEPVECTNGDCEFDDGHDDDDGDGFADEPKAGQEVIPQGVAMDKLNGKINLKQTITNGALGANPLPGTFKNFTLNYRISDKSAKALNKIHFRLYYFNSKAEIPDSIKRVLKARKPQIILNKQSSFSPYNYSIPSEFFTPGKAKEIKCRPPYIIVVKQ